MTSVTHQKDRVIRETQTHEKLRETHRDIRQTQRYMRDSETSLRHKRFRDTPIHET